MKKYFPYLGIFVFIILAVSSCDPREDAKQPTADFDYSPRTNIAPGDEVTFTNLSEDAESFEWNFDDGSAVNVAQNPTHIFDEEGEYDVTLTVQNKNKKDQEVKRIVVENQITACFTVSPNPAGVGETLVFTNCSEGADSYEWDINGDGEVDSTDEIPEGFYFTVAGTFNVKLKAISGDVSDTKEMELVIEEGQDEVVACFNIVNNPAELEEILVFENCSEGADTYEWDLNSDGEIDDTDAVPMNWYFTSEGTFTVTLYAKKGSVTDIATEELVIGGGTTDPAAYWGVTYLETVYYNNFSEAGDWPESSGEYYETYFDISNGYYTLKDTKDEEDYYGRFYYTNAAELPTEEYWELEANIRNTVDNGSYGSGLLFGLNDSENTFNFLKFSNSYFYTYVYGTGSGWQSTEHGNSADWNKLTVRRFGSVYYFFVNEELVYSEDAQDYGSKFGFAIDKNTHVDVDEVGVWTIKSSKSKQNVIMKKADSAGKAKVNTLRTTKKGMSAVSKPMKALN